MFKSFLSEKKEEIRAFLNTYFEQKRDAFAQTTPESADTFTRLARFSTRGGMIRGVSALMAAELWGQPFTKEDALRVAATCELLQSALLIHDDVFDKDFLRRGEPTVFAQYVEEAKKHASPDSYHWGESQGINAGDIAFLLAYDLACSLDNPVHSAQCIRVISQEITTCVLGQMQDLQLSLQEKTSEQDILSLYRNKTSRYTFSLPLQLGALISNVAPEKIAKLAELGEYTGILFQIKDDELNLFGEEHITGKPVGSDVREKKKTLFWHYLMESCNESQRSLFSTLYGTEPSPKDIADIRAALHSTGALAAINETREHLLAKARAVVDALSIDPSRRLLVESWFAYNVERVK